MLLLIRAKGDGDEKYQPTLTFMLLSGGWGRMGEDGEDEDGEGD